MTDKLSIQMVLSTAPSAEVAENIARTLLEEELVGCVNIVPAISSLYIWDGKLCKEEEVLMVIKSLPHKLQALEVRLLELHPYDTPEFVAFTSSAVSDRYRAWLVGLLGDHSA